ncbi:MAG: LysE family transporter [Oscillibacter sp.]|nr:LysE family transporter [Oscillibacter sp.]
MPVEIWRSFLIYCGINAFTPGPGNILALDTVANYGWARGRPLFFGIFTGYYLVQLLCAAAVYGVSAVFPHALVLMKYVGAAYILYLAVHIVLSRPAQSGGERSASFAQGFALQLVNIKIYLFGITALTGFVVPFGASPAALLRFALLIASIGSLATGTWICMGVLIRSFYSRHYRLIHLLLALALLRCAYSMLR